MAWVFCYDMVEDRRRAKVYRVLKSCSIDSQKSGFEYDLEATPKNVLADILPHFIELDSLLVAQIDTEASWRLGRGVEVFDKGEFIVFS